MMATRAFGFSGEGFSEEADAKSGPRFFIGGLNKATTNESFCTYFSSFGKLDDAYIVTKKVNGLHESRGFGFVQFSDASVVDLMLSTEHILDGRKVEMRPDSRRPPHGKEGGRAAPLPYGYPGTGDASEGVVLHATEGRNMSTYGSRGEWYDRYRPPAFVGPAQFQSSGSLRLDAHYVGGNLGMVMPTQFPSGQGTARQQPAQGQGMWDGIGRRYHIHGQGYTCTPFSNGGEVQRGAMGQRYLEGERFWEHQGYASFPQTPPNRGYMLPGPAGYGPTMPRPAGVWPQKQFGSGPIGTGNPGRVHGRPRPMNVDNRKVFVGGLPASVSEADFGSYFCRYGFIVDCVVLIDRESGRSRGFGFVTYAVEESADAVLMEEHMLHGKVLDCKRAQPKVEQVVAAGGINSLTVEAGATPHVGQVEEAALH